jgi:mRNA interferase RelE/StbE
MPSESHFSIVFSKKAASLVRTYDKNLRKRLQERIKKLQNNPVPHNSVRIVGEKNMFRIRIGDYRVLYEINWRENLIIIEKIDKRGRVYKR